MKFLKNIKILLFYLLIFSVSFTFLSFNYSAGVRYKMRNSRVIERIDDGALYLKGKINLKFKAQINSFGQKTFGIQKLDDYLVRFNPAEVKQIHPFVKGRKQFIGDDKLAMVFSLNYDYDIDPGELSQKIFEENKDIIEWVEPDYVYEADFVPNDPSIGAQWFISKISSYQAWDLTQGDTNVIIGMIDTGSDFDHPDLASNIYRQWAENPTNGIDDDNNGYVDDWHGWDFAGGPNVPPTGEDNDPQIYGSNCDHGSHTSGCASEVTNNSTGGAGIGFKCKLLICKHGADNDYSGPGGVSYLYNTNSGIAYAYQNGAKVINCSFGSSQYSAYTQMLVNNAWANGTIVVASAGNEGLNIARYPASYDNVISVAATGSNDIKPYWSNYHTTVDICAPGSSIYSTLWNNTYAYYDGTSMSAPIVAGTVGLIRSRFYYYTASQVVAKLLAGVDSIYNLNPGYVGLLGSGRVNAFKCVSGVVSGIVGNNGKIPGKYILSQNYPNPFNPVTKINFDLPENGKVKLTVYDISGKVVTVLMDEYKNAGSYTYQFDGSALSSGIYFYKIKTGNFTDTKKMSLIK